MSRSKTISFSQLTSVLLMILALLWLSISTPFVYAAQQDYKKTVHSYPETQDENLPLASNTTEEKSESSTSTLSEYLHELLHEDHPGILVVKYYKCHPADIYLAFHPQLISPPPEV